MTHNNGAGKTLVLGVGNVVMGDEGFGVHVVRRLKEVDLPSSVKVEEGGVGGFNLLGSLEDVERLIVVDVMMLDTAPGELRLLKAGPELKEPGKRIVSFHQVGILELLQMRELLGQVPETVFLVTRPVKLEWGTELSTPVQQAADRAVQLIPQLCQESFEEGSYTLCSQ